MKFTDRIDERQFSTEQISDSNWEPVSSFSLILCIHNVYIELFSKECETDDPIVLGCREKLKQLPFQWVKFNKAKKANFCPAFIHPAEPGKKPEAQKVTPDGYLTSRKYEFFDQKDKIEESEKTRHKIEIYSLNKFNGRFKSNFQ